MVTHRSHSPLTLVAGGSRREVGDAELARRLITGDAWAIGETWHRFAPMVLVMAERALGSKSEAQDVAQETFHRVFRKAKTLREPEKFRSFIYSFAIRTLKAELHRRKLRSWLSFDDPETLVDIGGPSLDVEARDLLRRFHGLLDRLSSRDRLVFVLRRMESMTVEEISASMALSRSTVKRSMAHASGRLSRWIQSDPGLAAYFDTEQLGR